MTEPPRQWNSWGTYRIHSCAKIGREAFNKDRDDDMAVYCLLSTMEDVAKVLDEILSRLNDAT